MRETAHGNVGSMPAFLGAMTLVVLGLVTPRSAGQSDSPADRAAKLLERGFEPGRSIEVRDRTDITHQIPPSPTLGRWNYSLQRYVETPEGRRFTEYRGMAEDKVMSRWTCHLKGNGEFGIHIMYDRENVEAQKQIHVTPKYWMEHRSNRKQVPTCLLFLYVGDERLDKALPKGKPLGGSHVLGRACDDFLFTGVRWFQAQDQVYHLDRETAIPLKVEAFADQAAREAKSPLWVWTADSLDEVEGRWLVLRSTQKVYQSGEPSHTYRNKVEGIEFGKEYPASLFDPKFDSGVAIVDEINNEFLPPAR